jgi:hypothetical protein
MKGSFVNLNATLGVMQNERPSSAAYINRKYAQDEVVAARLSYNAGFKSKVGSKFGLEHKAKFLLSLIKD